MQYLTGQVDLHSDPDSDGSNESHGEVEEMILSETEHGTSSNIVAATLFLVVNNIVGIVTPDCRLIQAQQYRLILLTATMLPHNVVGSCFQQPVTAHNFWLCIDASVIL